MDNSKKQSSKNVTQFKQPEPVSMDLITAAKSGDRLETLKALRDLLAEQLQNSGSGRDVASMSRRLMQTVAEIETLEQVKKAKEENPFNLTEFRKKAFGNMKAIGEQYKLGAITNEHEDV